jgi:hypothetical protein
LAGALADAKLTIKILSASGVGSLHHGTAPLLAKHGLVPTALRDERDVAQKRGKFPSSVLKVTKRGGE